MNTQINKSTITPEKIEEIRARFMAERAETNRSWTDFAKITGIPYGTISQWGNGNYGGDNAAIALKVQKYFDEQEARAAITSGKPVVPGFIMTFTARRIHNVFNFARSGEMCGVIGNPGIGKTMSIRAYQDAFPNVWLHTFSPTTSELMPALLGLCRAIGIQKEKGTNQALSNAIRDYIRDRNGLMLFDESQHMSEKALEEIRAIHDDTGVGVVFIGNYEIVGKIQGSANAAAFAQRKSRFSQRIFLTQPDARDIDAILDAWAVDDTQERAFLSTIAHRAGAGAIRTITQILKMATFTSDVENPRDLTALKAANKILNEAN